MVQRMRHASEKTALAGELAQEFTTMIRQRQAEPLDGVVGKAAACGEQEFGNFARV